ARSDQPVAREHTPRVGVGHEDRTVRAVEEDRVHRLGPETRYAEELAAKLRERRAPQAGEAPIESSEEPACEVAQPSRLQAEGPCAANDARELRFPDGEEPPRLEQAFRSEGGDGPAGVRPRRVLSEHGADRDLVPAPARPPALRTERAEERHVHAQEPRFDG